MTDLLRRCLCRVVGHTFLIVRRFGVTSRKLYCDRCHRYFAMNDRVQVVVPWDGVFDELYASHGYDVHT